MNETADNVIENALSDSPGARLASLQESRRRVAYFVQPTSDQIKGTSVRGGVVMLAGQGISFCIQTASMMILVRLLVPADFGITGMVAAATGFLALFGDLGLGAATIQRKTVTHEEVSTLFWINLAIGGALTMLTMALAPVLVFFYKEPRLFSVTIVSSLSFVVGAAGAQHAALMMRSMRYTTMTKLSIIALGTSSALGIGMATIGCGYWSLVAMACSYIFVKVAGYWIALPWRPGRPIRGCGILSMVRLGGTLTLNSLTVYVAYNVEKILLGRFFGAESLGFYGRAYQLLNLPLQQFHAAMYTVAFPGLSAIQDNTERLCRSFLKGYSVLLGLTLPIIIASSLFAEGIVQIVLGPRWIQVVPILRLLTPSILVFAMIDPFAWLLVASGRAVRSLKMAFVIAPTVILGITLGLRGGPKGVALGYSLAMCLLLVPHIVWALHGTGITIRDYWQTARKPLMAGLLAGAVGLALKVALAGVLNTILVFAVGMTVCTGVYAWLLLIAMGQKAIYRDLLSHIFERFRRTHEEAKLA